jgi:uncharacterized protein YndB with AHSA1/START domain
MDLRAELRYAADPDAVFAMVTDEEFVSKKLIATGALSHDVTVAARPDGGVSIHIEQVLPAQVPNLARRFVGETVRLRQTDDWEPQGADGSRTGSFLVEIPGLPGKMAGTLRLKPGDDGGTVEAFAGTIDVSIPFVGGKLAAMAADAVRAAIETEGRVGQAWLDSRRGPSATAG